MASPLVGAWKTESSDQDGYLVCTENHYSAVLMAKEQEPTESDSQISRGLSALSGAYRVSGARATFKREVNLYPKTNGVDLVVDFRIEGNSLTTKFVSGQPGAEGVEMSFRRVS